MTPGKVLVIRFSSIGDIILTSPVLRQLKQQMVAGSEVHYLTKPQFASILRNNPHVDRVIELDEDLNITCETLKIEEYDYVLDLHKNLRSALVKRKLDVLSLSVDKRNLQKWFLIHTPITRTPVDHIVKRYLKAAAALGCEEDEFGLDYPIPAPTHIGLDLPERYLVWVLGGAHPGKQMSPSKIGEIISQSPIKVVLLGGKTEADIAASLEKELDVINATGTLSLDQSALVVSKAEAVVSGDTGLMHITAALKVPLISIWGCTTPALGMAPYRPHPSSMIVEPTGRRKRPCSKLGNTCKYGMDQKCIDQIENSVLIKAINSLLELNFQTKP